MLALRQTAGRGREGRMWRAPEGNLNLSVMLRPTPEPLAPARWSLMAGIAVLEALLDEASRNGDDVGTQRDPGPERLAASRSTARFTLKWPNDVMLNGAKLAGLLIDSALTETGRLDWVVIGIGVNIAQAPILTDRLATSLAAHHIRTTPTGLAHAITAQLDRWIAVPLPEIVSAWQVRAHPPGTRLRVQQGTRMVEGFFEGLNADGTLRLTGAPAITTGDVTLEDPRA